MPPVDVSVIVTTKNEEKNIENCLKSVKNQTYPADKIEIIVVDNNSTDRTVEIAKQFTDKVFTKGPERSAQRNYGIENASGEYILYLDADMILSETVLSECYNKCEDDNLIALYIPEEIIGEGFWIKVRNFERSFYNGTVIDCVRFILRDKFLEIGGFDLNLTGPEDWDLDRRINDIGKVAIINSPLFHHEGNFNIRRYLKKKAYYAGSFEKYVNKWSKKDKIVKKQLGFYYRLLGVFYENGKWTKMVMHPALSIMMYWLKIRAVCFILRNQWKNSVLR